MDKLLKRMSPARIVALGFALVILIGSGLLMLPVCVRRGIALNYIDALYTAASAVCVTGLVTVDVADTFTPLGQFFVGLMMQIGGLGVALMGAGVILATGRKFNLRERALIRESMNLFSGKGIVRFIKNVFFTTVAFELTGAALSLIVFARDYPLPHAIGISLFHSVAAFNNSGFDILGGGRSMTPYKEDVLLNIITCALIFAGGIGFLVIHELFAKRFRWRRLSMHAKVVLSVSAALIVAGALIIKLTENISWLGAFFTSVSARTAGFASYPLGEFSNAGLMAVEVLMFIGASPGSTGGGIKTSTLFALLIGVKAAATNQSEKAFRYSMPVEAFRKAAIIAFVGLCVVVTGTYALSALEPGLDMRDALFEVVSAFGTVGLSTGITGGLSTGSKLLSIAIMFIGRIGPLTIITLWYFSNSKNARFPYGNIAIG